MHKCGMYQEESERERKAMEEEMKRQKRLEKQKEIELRRKEDQDNKAAWLDSKEASRKRKEEAARIMKVFEDEGRQKAMKVCTFSVTIVYRKSLIRTLNVPPALFGHTSQSSKV